jgi:DNA-binding CsgD family transcriptional regulator
VAASRTLDASEQTTPPRVRGHRGHRDHPLVTDELRFARAGRERYVGGWLPEPITTDGHDDPARQAGTALSLSWRCSCCWRTTRLGSEPRSCAPAASQAPRRRRGEPPPSPPLGLVEPLTDRELEVLRLLAVGRSNQRIARDLVVALDAIKKQVTHVLGKLGAANRTKAAARGRELGLIP